jgi:2-dehydro-3-deoxygluconokinase
VPEVVTLGETMVLMDPSTSGPLRYVPFFHKSIAGAESNLCIGLVRLGHSAGWISNLGDDEFGKYILSFIRGEGVDVSQVQMDPQHSTGVMFKERREVGETKVYYYRKDTPASRMQPEQLDPGYIASAKFLHVTGITPALSPSCAKTVWRAMELAQEAGVKISFDPNLRLRLWKVEDARREMPSLMAKADVVLPGIDEAEIILGTRDPGEIAQRILELGPQIVAVKLGKDGAYVAHRDGQRLLVPGFPIERVVDPVGAGDGFAAGFLAGLIRGYSLEEAARLANGVGAMAVTVTGDIEGLPTERELAEFLGEVKGIDR